MYSSTQYNDLIKHSHPDQNTIHLLHKPTKKENIALSHTELKMKEGIAVLNNI